MGGDFKLLCNMCVCTSILVKGLFYSHINNLYTGKTYTHNFHAITFSYENRMKIIRISCEKIIHVNHAKKIYNFHVKIMPFSYLLKPIHMRLSCES